MGMYIKGMEMPKGCSVCILFGEYGCPFVGAVGYALTRGGRYKDCPLVPVPPHGRLIDADAACYQLEKRATVDGQPRAIRRARRIVAEMPTIIPAEEGE